MQSTVVEKLKRHKGGPIMLTDGRVLYDLTEKDAKTLAQELDSSWAFIEQANSPLEEIYETKDRYGMPVILFGNIYDYSNDYRCGTVTEILDEDTINVVWRDHTTSIEKLDKNMHVHKPMTYDDAPMKVIEVGDTAYNKVLGIGTIGEVDHERKTVFFETPDKEYSTDLKAYAVQFGMYVEDAVHKEVRVGDLLLDIETNDIIKVSRRDYTDAKAYAITEAKTRHRVKDMLKLPKSSFGLKLELMNESRKYASVALDLKTHQIGLVIALGGDFEKIRKAHIKYARTHIV